jgi:two-component system, OmpR family, sensor histidine kinase MtrB
VRARLGLRSRVALTFGLLSFVVALTVSGSLYLFARSFLVDQRESSALTRALIDSRAVEAALIAGKAPGDAVAAVPQVGASQALVRVGGTWFTSGVTVSPGDLPQSLVSTAEAAGGAHQRFRASGAPYVGVAVAVDGGYYLELFPLDELDVTLRTAGGLLLLVTALAFVVGTLIGRSAAGRLMSPVRTLGEGARLVADGDLEVRLPETGDPDLDPIRAAFNDMTYAVRSRIERESRFAANVSHELRSPLTTVVGTAELLERHSDRMDPREARLVSELAGQARRLSATLLDLLEISTVNTTVPVQSEATDIRALAAQVLQDAGLSEDLLRGDQPYPRTDARRVERIIANLVENAQRHGGGLTEVIVERDLGQVCVHVDDSGPGIPADQTQRLFEPFVRGDGARTNRVPGAGLGLTIAHEQAAAIGGAITVCQAPTGGARCTLTIPENQS